MVRRSRTTAAHESGAKNEYTTFARPRAGLPRVQPEARAQAVLAGLRFHNLRHSRILAPSRKAAVRLHQPRGGDTDPCCRRPHATSSIVAGSGSSAVSNRVAAARSAWESVAGLHGIRHAVFAPEAGNAFIRPGAAHQRRAFHKDLSQAGWSRGPKGGRSSVSEAASNGGGHHHPRPAFCRIRCA
ncbi:hypothetical protein GCM10022380_07060 [Amycolatopsis tucumanensis]|uniref:Uncharacterized protein n=1 Tax=Amycolatopsis tucumanensis TaxID=401106 RepID=A0ABP7HIR4_9PSEU